MGLIYNVCRILGEQQATRELIATQQKVISELSNQCAVLRNEVVQLQTQAGPARDAVPVLQHSTNLPPAPAVQRKQRRHSVCMGGPANFGAQVSDLGFLGSYTSAFKSNDTSAWTPPGASRSPHRPGLSNSPKLDLLAQLTYTGRGIMSASGAPPSATNSVPLKHLQQLPNIAANAVHDLGHLYHGPPNAGNTSNMNSSSYPVTTQPGSSPKHTTETGVLPSEHGFAWFSIIHAMLL